MLHFILFLGVAIVSIIFHIASATGFVLPLAYGLIVPTLFYDWFHANQALAEGIGWGLVALAALLWLTSLVRRISKLVHCHRKHRADEELFLYRLQQAKAQGSSRVDMRGC